MKKRNERNVKPNFAQYVLIAVSGTCVNCGGKIGYTTNNVEELYEEEFVPLGKYITIDVLCPWCGNNKNTFILNGVS